MNDSMTQSIHGITGELPGISELTESEHHQLLASERRRIALNVLSEGLTPVTLGELVSAVAKRDPDVDASDESHLKRVRISLHHNHLPKMADMGVIDYDTDSRQVT